MPKTNLVRNVVTGDDLTSKIKSGLTKIYDTAICAFGANSGNVLIENRYGEPTVSHDGITNIASLQVADPIENAAISIARQASAKTDLKAGDGTTLTVVLTKLTYDNYRPLSKDISPRELNSMIDYDTFDILKRLDAVTIKPSDLTDKDYYNIALTATGDKRLAQAVDLAVANSDGGAITVSEQELPQIDVDIVEGFAFNQGLTTIALANDLTSFKSYYDNPLVIVLPKTVKTDSDIIPILERAIKLKSGQGIILIADVIGQALETIVCNKLAGKLDVSIVAPPFKNRDEFLQDVAKYSNCKPFTLSPEQFSEEYLGTVENAQVASTETVLNGSQNQDLDSYIEKLSEDRQKRLKSKTVKISVGANTLAERHEAKLRIDDGVCAVLSAKKYGALYGAGTALRDIALTSQNLNYLKDIYSLITSDGCTKLKQGLDLTTDEIKNMREAGVLDSALAIKEAVANSASAVKQLLSIKVALPFEKDLD